MRIENDAESIALFVFMPFCKIKCTYCDFNVYANLARLMGPYAEAVAREIASVGAKHLHGRDYRQNQIGLMQNELHQNLVAANASPLPTRAKSIYFGGGTPSLVPVSHIERILCACEESFAILPDAEITLEANPGTMDLQKLCDLRALGVNRLSIGVQAFDDATMRRLNRGHTVADALKTFEDARRAGFANINFDFIYGLPLQTMDDWRATLERALVLSPEHLSLYALRVEEKTGLEYQIKRGKYSMPDDDLAAEMYELAEEMLDEAGYEHYEISNWSLEVRNWKLDAGNAVSNLQPPISNFQSRHTLTYWHNEPYLGFGAGAHSYFGGERYWNVLSPAEYIQRIAHRQDTIAGREEINRELEMAESMILGLRLGEGIAFERFQERFEEDAREKYRAQMAELEQLSLVEFERPEGFPRKRPFGSHIRLTPRGRLLSNEVFWRFLP